MRIFFLFLALLLTNQSFSMITPAHSDINDEILKTICNNMKSLYNDDPMPITSSMEHLIAKKTISEQDFIEQLQSVQPILSKKTRSLFMNYFNIQNNNDDQLGTTIYRFYTNRPKAYVYDVGSKRTYYQLNDSTEEIITEIGKNPFNDSNTSLSGYLSSSERELSQLLGVASKALFINNADPDNCGTECDIKNFIPYGYLVGLVGAYFETKDLEWKHMIITQEQNTTANGYGIEPQPGSPLYHWAKFYNVKQFISFDQIASHNSHHRYHKIENYCDPETKIKSTIYLDTLIYKKRMHNVIKPFLDYADKQGEKHKKQVFVHAIGLGLDRLELEKSHYTQQRLLLEVYHDIIKRKNHKYIKVINFSDLPGNAVCGQITHFSFTQDHPNNPITILFNNRNVADPLEGEYSDMLLVAQYSWNGFSYAGNEFWLGCIAISQASAVVANSNIAAIQTPFNPYYEKSIIEALSNSTTISSSSSSEADNEELTEQPKTTIVQPKPTLAIYKKDCSQDVNTLRNKPDSMIKTSVNTYDDQNIEQESSTSEHEQNTQQEQSIKSSTKKIYVIGGIVTLAGVIAFLIHHNRDLIGNLLAGMLHTISSKRFMHN